MVETGTLLAVDTQCAASGAYAATSIVQVMDWTRIVLTLNIDAAALGGFPSLIPRVSYELAAPAWGDDVWHPVMVPSSAPALTLISGAMVAGTDYTGAPEFGRVKMVPLDLVTEAHDAASNEIRGAIPLELNGARWFSIQYAEAGVTGTPCKVGIDYALVK